MLNQFDYLPEGLLSVATADLADLLEHPTLIHLPGERSQPLFISTLLHGNETTGFRAIQQLLERYPQGLPRALSVFIGNVEAAAAGVRMLPGQADFNRVWPGTPDHRCQEADLMQTVTGIMRARRPFASIDIHNNTGRNPHYACVNVLSAHSLQVASRFSETIVYFTSPKGVQSSTFAEFCPAVVLECGQSSDADSVDHATRFLDTMINLGSIPGDHPHDVNIYHTVARVKVPGQLSISTSADSDIRIDSALEQMNFRQLDAGSVFARSTSEHPLLVLNESNEDVTGDVFERQQDALMLRRDVILSMFTTDITAIRQDVLCYFMERLSIQP